MPVKNYQTINDYTVEDVKRNYGRIMKKGKGFTIDNNVLIPYICDKTGTEFKLTWQTLRKNINGKFYSKLSDWKNNQNFIQKILKDYLKCGSITKACEKNHICHPVLKECLGLIGAELWYPPHPQNNKDFRSNVLKLYSEGKTIYQIKALLGEKCSNRIISKILKEDGADIRVKRFDHEKNANHNAFSKINNEKSAYFLGLLLADGSINKGKTAVTLSLQKEDSYLVQEFLNYCFLEEKGEIKLCTKNKEHYKDCYRGIVCSKKMCEDLNFYGCSPKKDYTAKIKDNKINKKVLGHLLRGIFDGDGSIFKNSAYSIKYEVSFTTASSFMRDGISKLLKENNIYHSVYDDRDSGRAFSVEVKGRDEVVKLFNFMYKDASIFMTRKFDKFVNHLVVREEQVLERTKKQRRKIFLGVDFLKTKNLYKTSFNGNTIGYSESVDDAAMILTSYKLKNCKDTYAKPDQLNWPNYADLENLISPTRIIRDLNITLDEELKTKLREDYNIILD